METITKSFSNMISKPWKSNMDSASYKQLKRTYQDGFSFNFPFALSGFNDFKTKEYSNLYLTRNLPASWFLNLETSTMSAPKLMTFIQSGSVYLSRNNISIDQFDISFSDEINDTTYFDIEFHDSNLCTVSFLYDGKKYYLAEDSNVLKFLWDFNLPSGINQSNPQYFKCVFNDKKELYLIKYKNGDNNLVKKTNDTLTLVELTAENKTLILNNYFKVSRTKEYLLNKTANTSFITYSNDSNKIDYSKSVFDLNNNFLIHSPYSSEYKNTIILKNQLTLNDTFTNGNNLLSSGYDIAVDNFRNYTNITNPIDSENASEISLNYVFYNKPYLIRQGITEFQAPSSMYPFTNLNINDTRFIDAGAYAFDTPLYADKIFQLNTNSYNNDGKTYLCTWLSGSKDKKMWVDRYYYPDLISKKSALSQKGVFDSTYNQTIESIITNNSSLSSKISKTVIFDKKSDLSFKPNQKYKYYRFANESLFDVISSTNSIACGVNTIPSNYYSSINDSGKLTISFYFKGDDPEWTIKSLRNNIDAGIQIKKTVDEIYFEYKLFDNSNNQTLVFSASTAYKKYKENFICFSYDALTGDGFFFLNNQKILTIETQTGQFSNKRLLYGRLYYNNQDLLDYNPITSDIFISDQKIEENLAFILPFIQNRQTVDDIIITLPCGMRNSIDDLNYIQSICNNNVNKSNYINISIDNIGISNTNTLIELEQTMMEKLKRHIPATSTINKIKFTNYI